jgi:hypothetical protein
LKPDKENNFRKVGGIVLAYHLITLINFNNLETKILKNLKL